MRWRGETGNDDVHCVVRVGVGAVGEVEMGRRGSGNGKRAEEEREREKAEEKDGEGGRKRGVRRMAEWEDGGGGGWRRGLLAVASGVHCEV